MLAITKRALFFTHADEFYVHWPTAQAVNWAG